MYRIAVKNYQNCWIAYGEVETYIEALGVKDYLLHNGFKKVEIIKI